MMTKLGSRKSWREKLEHPSIPLPKIVTIPPKWRARYGAGTMAIPRPLDVDALVRGVSKGKLVTQTQLRETLARKYKVDHTCPLTTGIFLRIAAEVAEEDRRAGKKRITPYWRVVRDDGSLNEKFPGGPQAQARRLRAEGFRLLAGKSKRGPRVRDLQRYLDAM